MNLVMARKILESQNGVFITVSAEVVPAFILPEVRTIASSNPRADRRCSFQ